MKYTSVFVLPVGLELGGVTTWSIKMVEKLLAVEESAVLLKHSEEGDPVQMLVPAGIELLSCFGASAYSATLKDVISYLPTYNSTLPATIFPNWSSGSYAACALLSLTKSQFFRTVGFAHTDEIDYYKWLQYYESIIHVFVAVSDDVAITLKKFIPHRETDIVIRPYAVEVQSKLAAKFGAGIPLKLVYAGRLEKKQKRIFDLVNLIRNLEERKINFNFRIIGEGSQKLWLENELNNLPLTVRQKISLEGAIPHAGMQYVWQTADVCILVSDYEGISISMLEAMSCGCIPVSTSVSGVAAAICNGVNGFTVAIGDMSAMSQIIENLTNNRNLLRKISERAYLTAKSRFSYEEYIPWFKQLTMLAWEKPPAQWPIELPILMPEIDSTSSAN